MGLNTALGFGVTNESNWVAMAWGTAGVLVTEGVLVIVGVSVMVGVSVIVGVRVMVGVSEGVSEGGK